MNANRYLFASFTRPEALVMAEIVISTASSIIIGSSFTVSWLSLALSISAVSFGVFLVTMFMVSSELSSKRREVAILRALGAKKSSLLHAFLTRTVQLALAGCAVGAAVGYCVAMSTAECSLLSVEIVGLAVALSLVSSLAGGVFAARRLSYLDIGEVLRQ